MFGFRIFWSSLLIVASFAEWDPAFEAEVIRFQHKFLTHFPDSTPDEVAYASKAMSALYIMDINATEVSGPTLKSCPTISSRAPAETIYDLHPSDIRAVGAIGDSISRACNAKSTSLLNMKDYPGISWIAGGDEGAVTMANIFQQYTGPLPNLAYGVEDAADGLDDAKDGAIAQDMFTQAVNLELDFIDTLGETYATDWKFVNLFIGGNNLCKSCKAGEGQERALLENYIQGVREALTQLNKFPRTFVSLPLILDITQLYEFFSGIGCQVALNSACPCAISSDASVRQSVVDLGNKYNAALKELVKEFPTRDDWAVVLQPALDGIVVPAKSFISAADCFHPSAEGQAAFATGLWNSVTAPVSEKKAWVVGDGVKCLTDDTLLYVN